MTSDGQRDDAERLRRFKAEFFKALGHPLRIWILELQRAGPLSVSQIQGATGTPGSSVSQQLAVLRSRNIVTSERRGTTIFYRAPDPELFEMLDVARVVFNGHLQQAIDLLRQADVEEASVGR